MMELLAANWSVVVFVAVILFALAAAQFLLGQDHPPYEKRPSLLTGAELVFYRKLEEAVDEQWGIHAMVRLADLIQVRSETPKPQTWLNRIHAKHVDFVLCDHETLEAKLAIELDDPSHLRAERVERDEFVNSALAAAKLPLLRVKASEDYDSGALRKSIDERLEKSVKTGKS